MVLEYESVIDSLVRAKSLEDPEDTNMDSIRHQLQSFLNKRFNEEQTHQINELINNRIRHYDRQRKLDKVLRSKLTRKKHDKYLLSFVYGKIYRSIWVNLLYEFNMKMHIPEEFTVNSLLEVDDVSDLASSSGEEDQSADESNIQPENKVYEAARDNLIKFELLNSSFKIDQLKVFQTVFRDYRAREYARQTVLGRNTSLQKSLLSFSDYVPQKLFTWTPAVQDLLNITQPLTIYEVVDLVCKYVNDRNMWVNEKFKGDGKVDFLMLNPKQLKTVRVIVLPNINRERVKFVGLAHSTGERKLLEEEQEPNAKMNCDMSQLEKSITPEMYNIPEKILRRKVQKKISQTDIRALFKRYYPKAV